MKIISIATLVALFAYASGDCLDCGYIRCLDGTQAVCNQATDSCSCEKAVLASPQGRSLNRKIVPGTSGSSSNRQACYDCGFAQCNDNLGPSMCDNDMKQCSCSPQRRSGLLGRDGQPRFTPNLRTTDPTSNSGSLNIQPDDVLELEPISRITKANSTCAINCGDSICSDQLPSTCDTATGQCTCEPDRLARQKGDRADQNDWNRNQDWSNNNPSRNPEWGRRTEPNRQGNQNQLSNPSMNQPNNQGWNQNQPQNQPTGQSWNQNQPRPQNQPSNQGWNQNQPQNQPTGQSWNQNQPRPQNQPSNQPWNQNQQQPDQAWNQNQNQPSNSNMNQPTGQSWNQNMPISNQPANQPWNQNQPSNMNQPQNQPTGQSWNQNQPRPQNQPSNQPWNQNQQQPAQTWNQNQPQNQPWNQNQPQNQPSGQSWNQNQPQNQPTGQSWNQPNTNQGNQPTSWNQNQPQNQPRPNTNQGNQPTSWNQPQNQPSGQSWNQNRPRPSQVGNLQNDQTDGKTSPMRNEPGKTNNNQLGNGKTNNRGCGNCGNINCIDGLKAQCDTRRNTCTCNRNQQSSADYESQQHYSKQ